MNIAKRPINVRAERAHPSLEDVLTSGWVSETIGTLKTFADKGQTSLTVRAWDLGPGTEHWMSATGIVHVAHRSFSYNTIRRRLSTFRV
jgi:hypothetical protein